MQRFGIKAMLCREILAQRIFLARFRCKGLLQSSHVKGFLFGRDSVAGEY